MPTNDSNGVCKLHDQQPSVSDPLLQGKDRNGKHKTREFSSYSEEHETPDKVLDQLGKLSWYSKSATF